MDYGMISQIEKGKRYAEQPERVTFQELTVTFKGDNDMYTINLKDGQWHCSCPGFHQFGICPHVMTLERLLKPMLKTAPLPYGTGQNVVSDVEKSHRYAEEKDRVQFRSFVVMIDGNNGQHTVKYNEGHWHCDSTSFKLRGVSSHTIAMERLLQGMLPVAEPPVD